MLGHTFNESENQPGQDGVVPLGYGLWKTRFGDASVLAKTLELSGRVLPVIGVMPPEFVYPPGAVMWSPVVLDDATRARRDFHRLRAPRKQLFHYRFRFQARKHVPVCQIFDRLQRHPSLFKHSPRAQRSDFPSPPHSTALT